MARQNGPGPVPQGAPDFGRDTSPPGLDEEMLRTEFENAEDSKDLHTTQLRALEIVNKADDEINDLVREEIDVEKTLETARENAKQIRTECEFVEGFVEERIEEILTERRQVDPIDERLGFGLVGAVAVAETLLYYIGFDAMVPTSGGLIKDLHNPVVLLGTLGVAFASAVATHQIGQMLAEIRQRDHLDIAGQALVGATPADTLDDVEAEAA